MVFYNLKIEKFKNLKIELRGEKSLRATRLTDLKRVARGERHF
jgi:hypothetical protein